MSKWTEFRDAIEADISSMSISETAKQELTKNLVDNVMPAVDAWVDKLAGGLIEEAKAETGWNEERERMVQDSRRNRPAVCAARARLSRPPGIGKDFGEHGQSVNA